MTEQDAFVIADEALGGVIDRIGDDQWTMPIPDWFLTGGSRADLDLRAIVNYHAFDDAWVPDVLAGKTMAEVGDTFDGDLLGDDPRASFRAVVERATSAARQLDDPDRVVHLSYGDFPAHEYLRHVVSFRGFRVYDIAKLIGEDTRMSDALVDVLYEMVVPDIEQWRAIGVFPPAVEPPEGADRQTRLLCLSGRQP
ncbi:MAG TPA: hypothetical protein VHT30_05900 [Acidimicrobiales bacterium]|jgi:uncharacterized protein (TIGR03086 family)|nr:hypothetical protein [Acidimicrobiales bacterium]